VAVDDTAEHACGAAGRGACKRGGGGELPGDRAAQQGPCQAPGTATWCGHIDGAVTWLRSHGAVTCAPRGRARSAGQAAAAWPDGPRHWATAVAGPPRARPDLCSRQTPRPLRDAPWSWPAHGPPRCWRWPGQAGGGAGRAGRSGAGQGGAGRGGARAAGARGGASGCREACSLLLGSPGADGPGGVRSNRLTAHPAARGSAFHCWSTGARLLRSSGERSGLDLTWGRGAVGRGAPAAHPAQRATRHRARRPPPRLPPQAGLVAAERAACPRAPPPAPPHLDEAAGLYVLAVHLAQRAALEHSFEVRADVPQHRVA
jgi:hypothetical protein